MNSKLLVRNFCQSNIHHLWFTVTNNHLSNVKGQLTIISSLNRMMTTLISNIGHKINTAIIIIVHRYDCVFDISNKYIYGLIVHILKNMTMLSRCDMILFISKLRHIYYANLIIIWFSFVIWYWTVTTALYITVIPQFLLNFNWIYYWKYCFNVKSTKRILTRQMEYRVNTHNVLYHMNNIMYFDSDMPNIIYNIWLKI